jgi:hypothetical protein
MADAASRAFDAQDALLALLMALHTPAAGDTPAGVLAGWNVDYGMPLTFGELECFVAPGVTSVLTDVTSGYPICADEEFTVGVVLYARKTGTTATEIREELRGAKEAIAAALNADMTLGGVVMQASFAGFEFASGIADAEAKSRDAFLTIDVACKAFIG